ncbi:HDAC7 deacetylase, partial [Xiphorhynchus elegans]|nr:HDAC7 deacetylase [Xiphorhynchus elegans]
MLKHQCSCGDNSNHPEHAGRIQSIWSRLQERGLRGRCEVLSCGDSRTCPPHPGRLVGWGGDPCLCPLVPAPCATVPAGPQGHPGGAAVCPQRAPRVPLRHQPPQPPQTGQWQVGRGVAPRCVSAGPFSLHRMSPLAPRCPPVSPSERCPPFQVDSDTIWNELHSSNAARWAAGSVTELAFKVATRELKNGFAVVRPPGHHADPSTAM